MSQYNEVAMDHTPEWMKSTGRPSAATALRQNDGIDDTLQHADTIIERVGTINRRLDSVLSRLGFYPIDSVPIAKDQPTTLRSKLTEISEILGSIENQLNSI